MTVTRGVTSACGMLLLGVSCVGMAGPIRSFPLNAATDAANHVTAIHPTAQSPSQPRVYGPTLPSGSDLSGEAVVTWKHSGVSAASTSDKVGSITAIGDSLIVDVAPYLKKLLPGIVVDGQIGRQLYQTPAVVDQLKSKGELGKCVIIELGTNGPFTKDQLVSLLNSLTGAQKIILVNTRVTRPWESVVNSTLADVASSFPNTTLVDWYAASAGKDSYFYGDGVHLNPTGAQSYAGLVADAAIHQ